MKKTSLLFMCGILISVVIVEGTIRIISPLLGPPLTKWNTMEDAKILKLEEFRLKHIDPDYVFMGNSTTLIGLDPSVFNSEIDLPIGSSFNAAMNGSEIQQIRDFACGYIIEKIRPKNLVILFSNSGMATNNNYLSLNTGNSTLEKFFYAYKYRNTFRDPMTINTLIRVLRYQDDRQGLVYRWADNLDDSGYSKYGTTESSIANLGWDPTEVMVGEESAVPVIEGKGMKYLVEIRDLSRKHGGDLIIGTVPTLTYDPNYRRAIEEMAKYLGVKFIQGNDAVGQGEYFQDDVHLNKRGAVEFSKYLARELSKFG